MRLTRRSTSHRHRLLLTVLSLLLPVAVRADVQVRVTDTSGAPLADAVVWLRDEAGALRARPGQVVVEQRDHRFVPFVQPVAVDTQVSFPNYDDTRHHVYSFSPAKTFEIKLYRGDPDTSITFDSTGVVALGCNIHDYMQGFIYVTDAPLAVVTDDAGIARFPDDQLAPGPLELGVWHPWQQRETGTRTLPGRSGELSMTVATQAPPPARPEENALRAWVQERRP